MRSVDIGAKPMCECGVFALENIPCGCMLIVCEEAGKDPVDLLQRRDTTAFWKSLYEDLPSTFIPGSEFLDASKSTMLAAPSAPMPPGRPSKRRIKSAIDNLKHSIKHSGNP